MATVRDARSAVELTKANKLATELRNSANENSRIWIVALLARPWIGIEQWELAEKYVKLLPVDSYERHRLERRVKDRIRYR